MDEITLERETFLKINPGLLDRRWPARWISCPDAPLTEFGVYHFRKTFTLGKKPGTCLVHVSADNRYRLFVNGKPVCSGPARGDIDHWRYESVDIAGHLRKGRNCIAAIVWNFGPLGPAAQLTRMTAFLLQPDDAGYSFLKTDTSWKVLKNGSYSPVDARQRLIVGPGERVDGTRYPWGWENLSCRTGLWKRAITVGHALHRFNNSDGWGWGLSPRNIPMMEETPIRFSAVRRSSGIIPDDGFVTGRAPLTIPARTTASFLLDQAVETTAFICMTVSKGKGSTITLTYGEALKDRQKKKHHRNDIKGLRLEGHEDIFIAGGGTRQSFRTLWWRTYRYVKVQIKTGDKALRIDDLHGVYTGYPFREAASFQSDAPDLGAIWDAGWRTVRLCAHETYMDCPYYEQLQYVGDTRIQCLISLYVSGDDRLFRNAIEQIDASRNSEGITRSSYPRTGKIQVIPPFSLYWVCMVHDYFMHRPDHGFVAKHMNGIHNILDWYMDKINRATGILGHVPYWNFVDWTREWPWDNDLLGGGDPPGAAAGGSSVTTLLLADTLDKAAELCSFFKDARAAHYTSVAVKLKKAVRKTCWDARRRILADTPDKTSFSQHANINAVLAGVFPSGQARDVMRRICSDETLIQCSLYYRFYLNQALKKAGLAEKYVAMLTPWHGMLAQGLTTFAELPDPAWTRSDCHAWSASPNYDLLATVAGIEPLCPGFAKVKIEPHFGDLKFIRATVPHPRGKIDVTLRKTDGHVKGTIVLPRGVTGVFISPRTGRRLKGGANRI